MKSKSCCLLFVCLLVSLTRPARAEPELKGLPGELAEYLKGVPKTVSVTGESEVKVEADKATVSLRVRTESKAFQESLRLNQVLRGKIIAFLAERGVTADKIKAEKFSSAPKYGLFSDKVKTYTVENVLKITVHDEKEFQAVATTADNWSEVHYEGAEFEHSSKQEMKIKALRQAVDNASLRKKVWEETLGVKLVPTRFFENALAEPALRNRSHYESRSSEIYKAKESTLITGQAGTAPDAMTETMSSFGELIFKAQVVVEYSLETK